MRGAGRRRYWPRRATARLAAAGLAPLALSIPRGRVFEHYGEWSDWIR